MKRFLIIFILSIYLFTLNATPYSIKALFSFVEYKSNLDKNIKQQYDVIKNILYADLKYWDYHIRIKYFNNNKVIVFDGDTIKTFNLNSINDKNYILCEDKINYAYNKDIICKFGFFYTPLTYNRLPQVGDLIVYYSNKYNEKRCNIITGLKTIVNGNKLKNSNVQYVITSLAYPDKIRNNEYYIVFKPIMKKRLIKQLKILNDLLTNNENESKKK